MGDKELLKLLRKNPSKGFDTLVAQYGGLLYTLVKSRLTPARCSAAEVEDIVADSFSDFYLHLGDYAPDRCSVKSYLCVIARNKAADILRKSRVTPIPLNEAEDVLDVADTLEDSELRADLLRAIKDLGEPDSAIIVRKYYLGESSADIARALDMTAANIDTRAHRAIKKLRKVFSGGVS